VVVYSLWERAVRVRFSAPRQCIAPEVWETSVVRRRAVRVRFSAPRQKDKESEALLRTLCLCIVGENRKTEDRMRGTSNGERPISLVRSELEKWKYPWGVRPGALSRIGVITNNYT